MSKYFSSFMIKNGEFIYLLMEQGFFAWILDKLYKSSYVDYLIKLYSVFRLFNDFLFLWCI